MLKNHSVLLEQGDLRVAILLCCLHKRNTMNLKRIFGAILTLLGIGGLIYAAIIFAGGSTGAAYKYLIVFGILGAIFFFTGIGLIRGTKDEAAP